MEREKRVRKAINWLIYKGAAENERELAERLGYTKSSFSQIVNGKVPMSDKFVNKLCSLDENLNSVWILTGEGEMFTGNCLNGEMTVNDNHITTDNDNQGNGGTDSALSKAIDEIGEQRKLVAKAQEQIDRLISLLERR